jgi:hypothetical protein
MKTYWGVDIARLVLTSALDGAEWSASHLCRLNPEVTTTDSNCIGGRVAPRADIGVMEKKKYFVPAGN